MESAPTWRKAAVTLGAGAVLGVLVWRLRRRAEGARSLAAPGAQAKAEEKLQEKVAPTEQPILASRSPVQPTQAAPPPPAEPAADAGQSLQAQKAAALGGAARAWAPDFNAPLEEDIERRLRARFSPTYLELINQGSCEALKLGVNMVSEAFRGQARVNRQRDVQAVLRPDLDSGRLHALSMQLKTPDEYAKFIEKQSQEAKPEEPAVEPAAVQAAAAPAKEAAAPAKAAGQEPPAAPAEADPKKPEADAKKAPKAKAQVSAGQGKPEVEKRVDPHSSKVFTFDQLKAYYKRSYTPKQIEDYWRTECKIGDTASGRKDPEGQPRHRAKAKHKPK